MKYLCNRDGFIKPLLSLIVLAFLIYTVFQFGIPYYRYSAFKSEVKEIAKLGFGNVEIKTRVYEAAQSFKIPIQEDDITVIKEKDSVNIKASWSVDVDILGLYQKRLDFAIDLEE